MPGSPLQLHGLPPCQPLAVMVSGGLDSCVLAAHLAELQYPVQPIYVRTGTCWQTEELRSLRRFLRYLTPNRLAPLVEFNQPVDDLYGTHWSLTGRQVPDASSPDEAVFLPGRNLLLLLKAAIWCQTQQIGTLALGTLHGNPFADARPPFFQYLERLIELSGPFPVRLVTPLSRSSKSEMIQLGRHFPLHETFSCLTPQAGLHCGQCNKCAERKQAFRQAGCRDHTLYTASETSSVPLL